MRLRASVAIGAGGDLARSKNRRRQWAQLASGEVLERRRGCNLKPFIVTQRVRRPPGKGGARHPEASLAWVLATVLVKRRQQVLVRARGSPLPSGGSRGARFPAFIGTMKPLRHPAVCAPRLMVSPGGPACCLAVCARRGAPGGAQAHPRTRSLVQPVLRLPAVFHADTNGISQVSW